jgi:hypothetical protein
MLQKAGIEKKISPHKLRHTYAANLLNVGVELVETQALLGTSKNLRFEKSAFVKSGSCIINLPRNRGFSRCPVGAFDPQHYPRLTPMWIRTAWRRGE